MVQTGTACRNAKLNMKSACDGIVEADQNIASKMEIQILTNSLRIESILVLKF